MDVVRDQICARSSFKPERFLPLSGAYCSCLAEIFSVRGNNAFWIKAIILAQRSKMQQSARTDYDPRRRDLEISTLSF